MTVSQVTAGQPSLITPLNSLLSVLGLTGEIIDFTFTNTDLNNQHERNRSFQQKKKKKEVMNSQTSSFIIAGQGSAISQMTITV